MRLAGMVWLVAGLLGLGTAEAAAQDSDSYGEIWVGGPFTGFTVSVDARPILGLAAAVNMDSAGIFSGDPFKAVFMDLRLSAGLGLPGVLWAGLIGGAYYLGADVPTPCVERPNPKAISDPGLEWGYFVSAGTDMDHDLLVGVNAEQVFLGDNTEVTFSGYIGPWGTRITFRYGDQLVMWNLAMTVNLLALFLEN